MDNSYSESDNSMSPSLILERLQVLRQLQLMQRGKLQKQRLEYQNSADSSPSITEIVTHFTNSTSYNTFQSLLLALEDSPKDNNHRQNGNLTPKVGESDLVEGVSILDLSQESEFVVTSPVSSRLSKQCVSLPHANVICESQPMSRISLDEMPILTPKKDFESLIIEKLKSEVNKQVISEKINKVNTGKKKFLKRGEGMARFGLKHNNIVIQTTKSLPWRQKIKNNTNATNTTEKVQTSKLKRSQNLKSNKNIQIKVSDWDEEKITKNQKENELKNLRQSHSNYEKHVTIIENDCQSKDCICSTNESQPQTILALPKDQHPLKSNKGKTWAAILTKEQDDFLRQLKQSNYYKNFTSPAKSTMSDMSCDETVLRAKQDLEKAEQNMFELLENKVDNESFNMGNSFFRRFLNAKLECSGESTPLIMQKCLANNPNLFHIKPEYTSKEKPKCPSEEDSCNDCIEFSDACSSVSCCCSCNTVENTNKPHVVNANKAHESSVNFKKNKKPEPTKNKTDNLKDKQQCQNDISENGAMKEEMAEMNAKLVATSELLKERLKELEDEIETFRKENSTMAKMRGEIDLERQKFYEEKSAYEQKFNEEKILSEYHLAQEKEQLSKQKQLYERYVREIRGRLNKKDKDEVVNLKKEISELKQEIRLKDAKSTSTIARLRNQLKIMEKEKKDLEDEVNKLKKENKRIQHSNDITRRLTNFKYLEDINKKLTNLNSNINKPKVSNDHNAKYKSFEIERQSRRKTLDPPAKLTTRQRAKSVPNLNVTSTYAKYFSQRDALSQLDYNKTMDNNYFRNSDSTPDIEENVDYTSDEDKLSDNENTNHLEKIYMERFQNPSERSSLSSDSSCMEKVPNSHNTKDFFILKTNIKKASKSPTTVANYNIHENNRSLENISGITSRSKSPTSILTNRVSSDQRATVINKKPFMDPRMNVTPEPSTNKANLSKTNLNPTEIRKPDGSRELRFPNGNMKYISADGTYSKFMYYNGDIKENFYSEGRIKYFYAEAKTYHTTHADGLEVLEFADGQVEKRYKDGSQEIRLPNGSVRYQDPKNPHVREEWRFPDGTIMTVGADGEQRITFPNGQVEVHAKDHKRREFPDGTVKLVYADGSAETRYASGRVRIKDRHGNLMLDSAAAANR